MFWILKAKINVLMLTERRETKKTLQTLLIEILSEYLCVHTFHPGSLNQSPYRFSLCSLFHFIIIILIDLYVLNLLPDGSLCGMTC